MSPASLVVTSDSTWMTSVVWLCWNLSQMRKEKDEWLDDQTALERKLIERKKPCVHIPIVLDGKLIDQFTMQRGGTDA